MIKWYLGEIILYVSYVFGIGIVYGFVLFFKLLKYLN